MTGATHLDPNERDERTSHALVAPPGYELLRVLGRGGCAVVYEARHRHHGIVALKLSESRARVAGSTDRRLAREAELLARVRHPNVLRVFEAGRGANGTPYLALEFLHGEDVESILARKRVFGTSVACEIVRQVLAALEAVHAAGIVHRDLKPNNVMIDEPLDGSPAVVKLIDFGIARGTNAERLTATGSVVGTPQYLAPEQVRGADFDERVDVWAAGILLFELLTGRTPFDGLGLEETFGATLYADLPDVRSIRVDVPASIADVVARALERAPDARHSSARAMRHALESAIAREGLGVGPRALGAQLAVRKRTLPFGFVAVDPGVRRDAPRDSRGHRRSNAIVPAAATPAGRFRTTMERMAASLAGRLRDRRTPFVIASFAVGVFAFAVTRSIPPDAETRAGFENLRSGLHGKPIAREAPPEAVDFPRPPAVAAAAVAEHVPGRRFAAPAPRDAHRAQRLRPPEEILASRARRALSNGQVEEAHELYDRATKLAPTYAPAWRGFALTAYELGNSGTARRAMRRYRALLE